MGEYEPPEFLNLKLQPSLLRSLALVCVAFRFNGHPLRPTASNDQTARVWTTADGSPISTLEGHTSFVTSVAFSPDGKRVALAGKETITINHVRAVD